MQARWWWRIEGAVLPQSLRREQGSGGRREKSSLGHMGALECGLRQNGSLERPGSPWLLPGASGRRWLWDALGEAAQPTRHPTSAEPTVQTEG